MTALARTRRLTRIARLGSPGSGGEPIAAPVNNVIPTLSGGTYETDQVTCVSDLADWDNADSLAFDWFISGATQTPLHDENPYTLHNDAAGLVVTCNVIATGPGGSTAVETVDSRTVKRIAPNPLVFGKVSYVNTHATNASNGNGATNGRVFTSDGSVHNNGVTLFGQNTMVMQNGNPRMNNQSWYRFDSLDVVLEAWVYPIGTGSRHVIAGNLDISDSKQKWQFFVDDSSGSVTGTPHALIFRVYTAAGGGSPVDTYGPAITPNAWNYTAFQRSGNVHQIWQGLAGADTTFGTKVVSTGRPYTGGSHDVMRIGKTVVASSAGIRVADFRIVEDEAILPIDKQFRVPLGLFPRS